MKLVSPQILQASLKKTYLNQNIYKHVSNAEFQKEQMVPKMYILTVQLKKWRGEMKALSFLYYWDLIILDKTFYNYFVTWADLCNA